MALNDLMLLDCTLRDGGYVNDWKWGFHQARSIIQALVKAKVDAVEVGFLRNVAGYDPDITVCSRIEELNRLLPEKTGKIMFPPVFLILPAISASTADLSQFRWFPGSPGPPRFHSAIHFAEAPALTVWPYRRFPR